MPLTQRSAPMSAFLIHVDNCHWKVFVFSISQVICEPYDGVSVAFFMCILLTYLGCCCCCRFFCSLLLFSVGGFGCLLWSCSWQLPSMMTLTSLRSWSCGRCCHTSLWRDRPNQRSGSSSPQTT